MRIQSFGACAALLLVLSSCADREDSAAEGDAAPAEDADAEETAPAEDGGSAAEEPADGSRHCAEADSDPHSVHVLVNKQNPLGPLDHVPDDLRDVDAPTELADASMREDAALAYEELHAAATEEGIGLWITTAYRDYDFQQALYEHRLLEDGAEAAERVSARPGHSEHQTGLAVDVADLENRECYLRSCFGETEQGRWLAERAHEFGFIIRYPQGAEGVTGFRYEPWHLRYLGEETAREVTDRGVTLEEYWGEPAAPDYRNEYAPNLAQ